MLAVVNELSDKLEWTRKVFDDDIVEKWRKESKAIDWGKMHDELSSGDMTDSMFEYCIKELRDKATVYKKHGVMPILDVTSCVVKSDSAIPEDLKSALRSAVQALENVPGLQKDWHPGSDGLVLDLVHPSLFPLIYGRSRILTDCTLGLEDCMHSLDKSEVVPPQEPYLEKSPMPYLEVNKDSLWSTRFQWLPCNISFPDGENARIDSCINNLHPEDHKDLALTKDIKRENQENDYVPPRPRETDEDKYSIACREEWDLQWREEYLEDHRTYIKPEPKNYSGHCYTDERLRDKFNFLEGKQRKLQVIVKLANIQLTPENPEYQGGSWHIEGQLNEHVISTALYYYDSENITDSQLHFRTSVDHDFLFWDVQYAEDDERGLRKIFGIGSYDRNMQHLGSVHTREDRLIAFPNGFQYRVGKISLKDPTKPGHRKITALFLVDPAIPIISTANIPPQQCEWWNRELAARAARGEKSSTELADLLKSADFPIGMEEAKKIREELMREGGRIDKKVDRAYADTEFMFCEH